MGIIAKRFVQCLYRFVQVTEDAQRSCTYGCFIRHTNMTIKRLHGPRHFIKNNFQLSLDKKEFRCSKW